jgi:hypothetical protein
LTGLTLTAGMGYGAPFGDMAKSSTTGKGSALSDGISGQLPLSLGVGYRPLPVLSFGLAVDYAPLFTKNCDPGFTCSGSDTRLGAEVRFHIVPEQSFSPWISLGGGWEWLTLSESGSGSDSGDLTVDGWDLNFQVGGDIRVNPFLTLGPYFGVRVGGYGHLKLSSPSLSLEGDIQEASKTTHGWYVFGVRGAFTLFPN